MARIVGNGRNNTLRGTGEDDDIFGRGGADRLLGRGDDDLLDGGGGRDRLDGGDDDDVLVGGRGNDRLTGGGDDDRFVFHKGRDVITDFRPGDDDDDDDDDGDDDGDYRAAVVGPIGRDDGDVVDLRDVPGINSFSDVRDAARRKGDDVVLRFSDDDRLTIEDFRVGQLERDDFLF